MSDATPAYEVLRDLTSATDQLLEDIDALPDAAVSRASLLPGWTRGHVLTHLARNAEGGTRLLGWARTGIPSYEYESSLSLLPTSMIGARWPPRILLASTRAAPSLSARPAWLVSS